MTSLSVTIAPVPEAYHQRGAYRTFENTGIPSGMPRSVTYEFGSSGADSAGWHRVTTTTTFYGARPPVTRESRVRLSSLVDEANKGLRLPALDRSRSPQRPSCTAAASSRPFRLPESLRGALERIEEKVDLS